MKSFLIFILLGLLVFVGWQYLIADNGYVLIEFLNYSIETSIPIFVACLIILYFVFRIFGIAWRSPSLQGRSWRARTRLQAKELLVELQLGRRRTDSL